MNQKAVTKKPESGRYLSLSHHYKSEVARSAGEPFNNSRYLQQTGGNQAVQRWFYSGRIQAKLRIGKPGDKYEQEADRMADEVMRMPDSHVRSQAVEDEEQLQAKPLVEKITPLVQRQSEEQEDLQRQEVPEEEEEQLQSEPEEEEEFQAGAIQRQVEEEEEAIQTKPALPRQKDEEEKPIQTAPLTEQGTPAASDKIDEDQEENIQAKRFLQKQSDEEEGPIIHRQVEEEEEESIRKMPVMQSQSDEEEKILSEQRIQKQQQEEEEEPVQDESLSQRQELKDKKITPATSKTEEQEDEEVLTVQNKKDSSKPFGGREIENRLSQSKAAGHSLDSNVRDYMEPRFGRDFSQVRVHSGTTANLLSKQINARAFTRGKDIYFAEGSYNPKTAAGQRLIAHELTHVIQQEAAVPAVPKIQRSPGPIADLLDKAARKIPGYTLITVILGKNPITGESVPRTAKSLLGSFLSLIPGGDNLFKKLDESGAIDEAFAWLEEQTKILNISWGGIKALISDAWDRVSIFYGIDKNIRIIKEVFGPTVQRIFNFVKSLGRKIMQFIFRGALKLVGAPVKQIMAILNKGKAVLTKIIEDPVGFIKNLVKALVQGVGQFSKNALKHLKAGISGWLFGTIAKAGIQLPEKFDIKGIFSLATQILNITYSSIKTRIIEKLGPSGDTIFAAVEESIALVKDLITRGPIALWERIREWLGQLKQMVFTAIIDWVKNTIIGKAITKLLSFFNPVGALVQAVIAIYNVIKFFMERIKQIAEFAESVFDSIAEIAGGNIKRAAIAVENAMAKSVPVIISFLARLIGLGGLSEKIQGIIKKIRRPVDQAIDKVIDWIVKKAKKLFSKMKAVGEKATAKILDFFGVRSKFTDEKRETHSIYYQPRGGQVALMVSSSPRSIRDFLDFYEAEYNIAERSVNGKLLIKVRTFLSSDIDPLIRDLAKAKRTKSATKEKDIQNKLLNKNVTLSEMLKTLLSGDRGVGMIIDSYLLEGLVGTYASMPKPIKDILTADHQPQAAILQWAAQQSYFGEQSKMAKRAAGRAAGGYAINLHEIRHMAGRTYGPKGEKTKTAFVDFVKGKIRESGAKSNPEKRNLIVSRIKWELGEDVKAMKNVANKSSKDKVWEDIHALEISKTEKEGLVKKIRSNILKGENQLANQDVDSLKK